MQHRGAARGFTLIELLVVIAIIGLLSSVVLASLNDGRVRARNTQRAQEVSSYAKAAEIHYASARKYPGNTTSLRCLGRTASETCFGSQVGLVSLNYAFAAVMNASNTPKGIDTGMDSGYTGYRYACTDANCDGYTILYALERPGLSCGTDALLVDPGLGSGVYTYCQIIKCPINTRPARSGNNTSTYICQ